MSNVPVILTDKEKVANIQKFLDTRKDYIAQIVANTVTPERLITVVMSACQRTPKLRQATPQSIYLALMQAGNLGLEPNTPLQLAWLIPYTNRTDPQKPIVEAQFQAGYRGLIRLAIQSGEVKSIIPRIVYEKDTLEIEYGLDANIIHRPVLKGPAGAAVAVYSVAAMSDGTKTFMFMTRQQVEEIRLRSQSPNEGPWVKDWEQMAAKTVIKRHLKYLPVSSERLGRAIEHDNRAEAGEPPVYDDVIDVSGEVVEIAPVKAVEAPVAGEVVQTTAQRAKETVAAKAAVVDAAKGGEAK